MAKHHGLFLIAAIAFILFGLLSQSVITQQFQVIDDSVSHMVYAQRAPLLTQLMIAITFFGGTAMLLIISSVVFLMLTKKKKHEEAFFFLVTFSLGCLLSIVLKAVVGRVRPDIDPLFDEFFYSYPSGHSMNSFILYALVAYFIYHFTRNTRLTMLATVLCSILILSIGLSRIYLGVHYPSDVLAGFLAGLGWVTAVLLLSRMKLFTIKKTAKK